MKSIGRRRSTQLYRSRKRRAGLLRFEHLEARLNLASFYDDGSGGLVLTDFVSGDTLDISKPDATHVQFTLGNTLGDTWLDLGAPAGVSGAGLATLTVSLGNSEFTGTQVTVVPSAFGGDTGTVMIHGSGAASPYPFSLALNAGDNNIHFVGAESLFEGSGSFITTGNIVVDAPLTTRDDLQMIAGDVGLYSSTITVNADVRTASDQAESGDINLKADSDITVNATVATGGGATDVISGIVTVESLNGALLGNVGGHIETGNVSPTGAAESGFINIAVAGEVRMAGTNALKTGNGSNTGDIVIPNATRISSDGGTGKLSLSVGALGSGATGHDQGHLRLGASAWGDPNFIPSDIYITSPNELYVGLIGTDTQTSQTVFIETTSGDLVIDNLSTLEQGNELLAGDLVTFRAAAGTLRWPSLSPAYPFDMKNGTLTLEADEIDLDLGYVLNDSQQRGILGTGTLILRPATAALDLNINAFNTNPTAGLDLNYFDLRALFVDAGFAGILHAEDWTRVVLGRETDGTGVASVLNEMYASPSVEIYGGDIRGGYIGGGQVKLQARTGSIGTSSQPFIVLNTSRLDLITVGAGSGGDIFVSSPAAAAIGSDTFVSTGSGRDDVLLRFSGGQTIAASLTLNDDLTLDAGSSGIVQVADGVVLRSATLDVLAGAIHTNQTGRFEASVGDMHLHSTQGPIGLRFSPPLPDGTDLRPVNVAVAGQLSLITEAPGGANGDISVASTVNLQIGDVQSGPDPDIVAISSAANVTFANPVVVNDDVDVSAIGTVNLEFPDTFETQNISVNAGGNIQGGGGLKTTGGVGIVLISVNGGVGANGVPIEVLMENGGTLVTTSTGDQYIATSDIAILSLLDAGAGTATLVSGTFQLSGDNTIADTTTIAILTNSTLDVDTANEIVHQVILDGGVIINDGGSISANGGTVLISGNVSGVGGDQPVTVTGDVAVDGENEHTGEVDVVAKVLLGDYGSFDASHFTVRTNGIIAGGNPNPAVEKVQIGNTDIDDGGTISPGASPSILRTKDLTWNSGGNYAVDIFGLNPGSGYDQLRVTGTVTINNGNLLLDFGSFTPPPGSAYTIITNDGIDPVIGQFAGFAPGTIRFVDGQFVQLSYAGGDGNDVVLTIPEQIPLDFGDVPTGPFAFGPVEILNSNAASDSASDGAPRMTTDGQGNWVAVWESYSNDFDILTARSSDNGQTWTAPLALNTNAATDSGDDYQVQIATDRQGTWIALWASSDSLGSMIGTDFDILVARSTDNGQTWTSPAPLYSMAATDGGFNDETPHLTTDGLGNWVAIWQSNNNLGGTIGSDDDILVVRSTDDGQTWSVPVALAATATTDTGTDAVPQVSTDGDGNWLAVWHSRDSLSSTIGTDADILLARSTDNGQTWSSPAPLNSNAALDTGGDFYPQVTADGQGTWIAVWQSEENLNGTLGMDFDILTARSLDNGQTWTAPAPLSSNAVIDSGWDVAPQLATNGQGHWVAVWSSNDGLGGTLDTDFDILFVESSDHGQSWSAVLALNSNASSDSARPDYRPQVAFAGDHRWLAVWQSQDLSGNTIGPDGDILFAAGNASGYPTLLSQDGARHVIVPGLQLGASIDAEADGQPGGTAAGDDLAGSPDDEDGVAVPLALTTGRRTFAVDLALSNLTGGDANLVGWIDFDANGSFDADEAATAIVASGATTASLAWSNIGTTGPDISPGETFARFRLTTDAITGADSGGLASDGEVEDYPVSICNTLVSTTNNNGPGSLRDAITCANAVAGTDVIAFAIPGPGPHTITPLSRLPSITDAVVIDGTTEPDYVDAPIVELDGRRLRGLSDGLTLAAGNSIVRGLVINRFGTGIRVLTAGGNAIEDNYIGTNVTGSVAAGNRKHGVIISDVPNNTLRRNVISGNGEYGVLVRGTSATANLLEGNFIGTNAVGTSAVPNKIGGVLITGSSGNTIGGSAAGAGNVISGNRNHGLIIAADSAINNVVQGNLIGVNATGDVAVSNGLHGVVLSNAGFATIGGAVAGAGNVISGNRGSGLVIGGATATNNVVQGNRIGTGMNGTAQIPNGAVGIRIANASNNTIGGVASGAGNRIAHNRNGVALLGNATGNAIRHNEIFDNASLGIDLGNDGATGNDATAGNEDADTGPNRRQNFPVIGVAMLSGGLLDVTYSVPSNVGNSAYDLTIDFYLADAANLGGKTYLGSDTYPAAQALLSRTAQFIPGASVASGVRIVATATDGAGNTSEFSVSSVITSPLMAAGGEQVLAWQDADAELSQTALQPIVTAALLRFAAACASPSQLALLSQVQFSIADLPGATLGLAGDRSVTLDATAAGHGWYIDQTPWEDSEFTTPHSTLPVPRSMDLLTAVMHELGHVLGWEHTDPLIDLMHGELAAGVRRLPNAEDSDEVFGNAQLLDDLLE